MIDIYCERTGPAFWAEPINALTNLCFLLAALILYVQARQNRGLSKDTGLLIALIVAIGIGSALFHTYATRTAMLADVLPIFFFQLAFLVIFSRQVIGLSHVMTFRLFMVYVLLTILSGYVPRDWLNGSLSYLPAFLFLLGFGIYHAGFAREKSRLLLIASGIFLLSLTFRSVDLLLCSRFEIGTHFLWHVLNAVVLYLCTFVIIRQTQPSHRAS